MRGIAGSRLTVVLVCIGLVALAASSTALATSASGTQNPDLTVSVSLSNDGGGEDGNGDTATAGESVTVGQSVTNNTSKTQRVLVTATLTEPSGESYSESRRFLIAAGRTLSYTFSYEVPGDVEKGTYQYTLSAANSNGTSSATAEITIY